MAGKKKEVEEKVLDRIIIVIDPELKALFKMVLMFERSNITKKVTELITAYTNLRLKDIKKIPEK